LWIGQAAEPAQVASWITQRSLATGSADDISYMQWQSVAAVKEEDKGNRSQQDHFGTLHLKI